MLRVLPAPKALLVFQDAPLRELMQRRITPDVLECESVADDDEALRRFAAEFRPVVLTDSLELVRKLRAQRAARVPFIVFVAEVDDAPEREGGILAGADECVGRRVSNVELDARIRAARRIVELESVLRITLGGEPQAVGDRRSDARSQPALLRPALPARGRTGRALQARPVAGPVRHRPFQEDQRHARARRRRRDPAAVRPAPAGGPAPRVLTGWRGSAGRNLPIVMPETAYEPGLDVARKLRAAVSHTHFKAGAKSIQVTASFGLCGMDHVPSGEHQVAEQVLRIADAALYRSKESGRNRVTAAILKPGG